MHSDFCLPSLCLLVVDVGSVIKQTFANFRITKMIARDKNDFPRISYA